MDTDGQAKVALVTGASRGLGSAIAQALGAAGWAVAVNYGKDAAGADATTRAIAECGGRAASFCFDVTNEAEVKAGVASVAAQIGNIDLLVNNATGPQRAVAIMDQSWSLYSGHFDFFVKAPLFLLQALLPDWRARKSGRVINIGSSVVAVGSPYDAHYVSAKGAMIGLTRSWASELGPEGITCNLVSPGWTPVERHKGTDPVDYERHISRLPLRRMGQPADVAGTVVFVASPAANYITGQNFLVNGGRTYS